MSESKEVLEATIKGLEEKLESVKSDLGKKVKELKDADKPEMTDEMYEKLEDLVGNACDELEIDEGSLEYELSMEYDNKVEMCSVDLADRSCIADFIMEHIHNEFKIVETEDEE